MKTLLYGLFALVIAAWGWSAYTAAGTLGGTLPWIARQEALYLSGFLAIALISLAMFLAARPTWLERPLGGLDRMYRTHKWAGILGVAFATLHWAIDTSSGAFKTWFGREGRVPKVQYDGLLDTLRDLGKDAGEWAFYIVLAMLVLALWRRFPYRPWRFIHQAMPVLYLMLAFHAVFLVPADYWYQPAGILLAFLLVTGVYGSVLALTGWIGRSRQVGGTLEAVERSPAGIVSVRCLLDEHWRGHRPGQFAFITFDAKEGAHPFTIAGSDRGDRRIDFEIKELGDYTRNLAGQLRPGQNVKIEGPYGCFDINRLDPKAQQVWVAGGIGLTPFLAWLESLQTRPNATPQVDLHYCTRNRDDDPLSSRLTSLCAALPSIRLHIHDAGQGKKLDVRSLMADKDCARTTEIWFCGPQGLADHLKKGLRALWHGKTRFHQEAFEFR